MIKPNSLRLLYLNIGHFTNHMLMLIFAKAAFSAGIDFGFGKDGAYAEMIPYGIPSLVLFGACAPLAALGADHWNRNGMLTVFFIGIGLSSILTGFAQSLLQIGFGLAFIGVFDHPYFAVTNDDGSYVISGLEPGVYVIEAWHEKLGSQTANVTVGDSAANFTFTKPEKPKKK